MPEVIYQGDLPAFTGRNVPIKEIASAISFSFTVLIYRYYFIFDNTKHQDQMTLYP